MTKIFCYGDSNTYGFDSRSPLGGRYPASIRWTNLIAERTGFTVVNRGQNGRELPRREAELTAVEEAVRQNRPDRLIVMLGSNDLLQNQTAEACAVRMETLLTRPVLRETPTLLIAPLPLKSGSWGAKEHQIAQSLQLPGLYRALAERLHIDFADAGAWNVETLFDGVHFSPAGHAAFAEGLLAVLTGN